MKKLINWKILLIAIIIFAAFLRFYQLGNIPYGSTDDEAFYIYSSYTLWHTGEDIQGAFLPLSFNAHSFSSISPVPVYLTAPFVGILGISLFSGRLLSVLLGVGSVFLLFLLTDYLFKNKWIGIIAALLFSISPWALQLGRTGLEVNYVSFFYLLGIYIFIRNVKNNNFLLSLIPFTLAFYSYHATKVFFVFLIPILLLTFRKELLSQKKQLSLFLIGLLFIFASFFFITKYQDVSRQNDINLFSDPNAAKTVDWERRTSTIPFSLRGIVNNKPLYFLRKMRENYLEAFSTNYLFLYGETGGGSLGSQSDNIYFRGELYVIELPLLLIGLYKLLKGKNKFNRNLLILLLLIGPIPSTFTLDRNYVSRCYMMLPALLMIISLGLYYLLKKISSFNKYYKVIFSCSLLVVYSFLFVGYFYQYFYRWPIYGAEAWSASSRDIINYTNSHKGKYKNIFISNNSTHFLLQYALFDQIDPKLVQKIWNEDTIKLGNITMLRTCLYDSHGKVEDFLPPNSLYISSFSDCHYSSIPSGEIVDRGAAAYNMENLRKLNKYSLPLILCISFFLRFVNYGNRWGLAIDQSRDVTVSTFALTHHLIPIIGPFSSAGKFVYGPELYWLISLFVSVYPKEVLTPWIIQSLLFVFITFVMYLIGKEVFNKNFGLLLSFLTAISTSQLAQSTNLTSPSLAGIFSVFCLYFFVRFIKYSKK